MFIYLFSVLFGSQGVILTLFGLHNFWSTWLGLTTQCCSGKHPPRPSSLPETKPPFSTCSFGQLWSFISLKCSRCLFQGLRCHFSKYFRVFITLETLFYISGSKLLCCLPSQVCWTFSTTFLRQ